jgi:hypothetical protein
MIRALTIVTCVLLDRLEMIEKRVERLRVSHGCAGDACAVCSLLDDIDAAFDSHGLAACLTRGPSLAPGLHWVVAPRDPPPGRRAHGAASGPDGRHAAARRRAG